MDLLWGKFIAIPEEQVNQVEHLQTFNIGGVEIKALHSPGHASHHIAYAIGEQDIVCGDVGGIRITGGPPVPPCPPPDIDLVAWRNSIDILLEEKPKTLHVAHFGLSLIHI